MCGEFECFGDFDGVWLWFFFMLVVVLCVLWIVVVILWVKFVW